MGGQGSFLAQLPFGKLSLSPMVSRVRHIGLQVGERARGLSLSLLAGRAFGGCWAACMPAGEGERATQIEKGIEL